MKLILRKPPSPRSVSGLPFSPTRRHSRKFSSRGWLKKTILLAAGEHMVVQINKLNKLIILLWLFACIWRCGYWVQRKKQLSNTDPPGGTPETMPWDLSHGDGLKGSSTKLTCWISIASCPIHWELPKPLGVAQTMVKVGKSIPF